MYDVCMYVHCGHTVTSCVYGNEQSGYLKDGSFIGFPQAYITLKWTLTFSYFLPKSLFACRAIIRYHVAWETAGL